MSANNRQHPIMLQRQRALKQREAINRAKAASKQASERNTAQQKRKASKFQGREAVRERAAAALENADPNASDAGITALYNAAKSFESRQSIPDMLSKQGYNLRIEHVPTGVAVRFPAFLTGYSDAYNVNWNSEEVFGRSDPIATYQNTRRAISISWQVVASSVEEARKNLLLINKLMALLYPLYDERSANCATTDCGGASTINMGPLLRISFGNLIQDAETGGGLLGYVNGFTVDPELDEGMFTYTSRGPMGTSGVEYIPKSVRLNCEMTVLHEHSLGWTKGPPANLRDPDSNREGIGTGQKYYFRGGQNGFPYATTLGNVPTPPPLNASVSNQQLAQGSAQPATSTTPPPTPPTQKGGPATKRKNKGKKRNPSTSDLLQAAGASLNSPLLQLAGFALKRIK